MNVIVEGNNFEERNVFFFENFRISNFKTSSNV